jgi:SAM-dependent methyltransferase
VGAGPVTSLGNAFPEKVLDITAIDPLANVYRRTLNNIKVTSAVRTLPYHGERILERFAPESFDFAYARNALDHSYDPVLVIQNMLAVVKEQGFVLLRHYRNEGEAGGYSGLHQWNFDLWDDSLVIWNEDCAYNVSQMLCEEAQIECYLEDSRAFGGFDHSEWVVCAMRKTAGAQQVSER